MTARCAGSVWVDSRMGRAACSARATRDGFCGIHHPDAVAKRKAKSDQHYAAQRLKNDAKWATVRRNAAKAELFGELVAALEPFAAIAETAERCGWVTPTNDVVCRFGGTAKKPRDAIAWTMLKAAHAVLLKAKALS